MTGNGTMMRRRPFSGNLQMVSVKCNDDDEVIDLEVRRRVLCQWRTIPGKTIVLIWLLLFE